MLFTNTTKTRTVTAYYRGPYRHNGIVFVAVDDFLLGSGYSAPDLESWFKGPLDQVRTFFARAPNGRLFAAYYHDLPDLGSVRGVVTYEAVMFRTHEVYHRLEDLEAGDESTSSKLLKA